MSAPQYEVKHVADPVHGTVELTYPEVELISTQAFQRLRNVKQLGLAHLVFPGADYSRLSHCVGVCHVTGRILNSLRTNAGTSIEEEVYQQYRLAGLLHDVGHFPFSHAFEEAVSDFYSDNQTTQTLLESENSSDESLTRQTTETDPPDHEGVGRLLLDNDIQIKHILDKYGFSSRDIYSIFARVDPPRFANLISSDLDADRIDYLLRTAHHTGLPYGSVDIEYILSQLRLDDENRICLTPKALRTAEHFLFCRYFDYQQTSYHKTVSALEEVLKDIVSTLLSTQELDCSPKGIRKMIETGRWYEFDDSYVLHKIRSLESNGIDSVQKTKVDALLRRVPPKLIGSIEFVSDRNKKGEHERNVRDLKNISKELSESFDIDPQLWYVWDSKGRSLTKVGSYAPVSMLPTDEDDLEQSIRIKEGSKSMPIVNIARSLMSILAQQALYTARLYVLLPKERESERQSLTESARIKINHEYWVDGK